MAYQPRHRASRAPLTRFLSAQAAKAPLAIVAATAAVAVPLAIASPASAATAHTWGRLASCESGGNWHINTGNGYYGGVQFSASTWSAYGGGSYARIASNASRYHQELIAQKVLKGQGWGAWPACSARLGLDHKDATAPLKKHAGHKAGHKAHHKTHHKAHRGRYVVKSGDTLSKIARAHQITGGWHHLYRLNRHVIGSNPNNLKVGEHLRLHR